METNMGYYLMVKTIDQTGLKYLCKCVDDKDHIKYLGSGKLWRRTLKKHPEYTVSTEVLGWYPDNATLRVAGLQHSTMFNVVESSEWANYIPEIGDGGATVAGRKRIHNLATKAEMLIGPVDIIPEGWALGGKAKGPRPSAVTAKIVAAQRGSERSDATKLKMAEAWRLGRRKPISNKACSICGRLISPANLYRHETTCEGTPYE